MANLTLARRDSYLEYLRGGVKQDALNALRTALVHSISLFPDKLLVKAVDDTGSLASSLSAICFLNFQTRTPTGPEVHCTCLETDPGPASGKERMGQGLNFPTENDNYNVQSVAGLKDSVYVSGKLESLNPSPVVSGRKDLTSKSETVNSHVNSCVVNVHSISWLPQKKGVIPFYCQNYTEIKYMFPV